MYIDRAIFGRCLWLVIAFFLLSTSYSTSQSIRIDDPGKVYNLRRDLEVLKGAMGNHAITDVAEAIEYGDFSPSQQNIPHFIPGNIPIWCRFNVENHTGENILLEIKNPDINKLDVFIAGDSGLIEEEISSGSTVPIADRLIKQKILYKLIAHKTCYECAAAYSLTKIFSF